MYSHHLFRPQADAEGLIKLLLPTLVIAHGLRHGVGIAGKAANNLCNSLHDVILRQYYV